MGYSLLIADFGLIMRQLHDLKLGKEKLKQEMQRKKKNFVALLITEYFSMPSNTYDAPIA